MFKQEIFSRVLIGDDRAFINGKRQAMSWVFTFHLLASITGITGFFFFLHCSQSVHVFHTGLF